ncbi:hypothetical protein [Herbiconiux sp. UC225_62]|uniref:hypothetical protein n=1 Tax=Herbiconiux sp. UC225_62 TaxID=3350168 RepID=UPI0036D35698
MHIAFPFPRGRSAEPEGFPEEFTGSCLGASYSMLAVLDETVETLADVDDLVAGWGDGSTAAARRSLRMQVKLARLHGWLLDLRCCPEHAAIQDESARLVDFSLTMLRHLHTSRERRDGGRLEVAGLGSPADRVMRLRDTLSAALRERPRFA